MRIWYNQKLGTQAQRQNNHHIMLQLIGHKRMNPGGSLWQTGTSSSVFSKTEDLFHPLLFFSVKVGSQIACYILIDLKI
jgi:hypothetical protein